MSDEAPKPRKLMAGRRRFYYAVALVPLGILMVLCVFHEWTKWALQTSALAGYAFVVLLVSWMILPFIAMNPIRCPDCRSRLRNITTASDATHIFACAKCNIEWDTGTPVSKD